MRALLFVLVALTGCQRDAGPFSPNAELRFVADGRQTARFTAAELSARLGLQTVSAYDPYYRRRKSFRAMPLAALLQLGFADRPLTAETLVLRARDGYAVPMSGPQLLEPGGFLAVADAERRTWEPIGEQKADPGPFYLIWGSDAQSDLERHPRPWQLESIELADPTALYPHTVPTGTAGDSAAMRGFRSFFGECIRCHAINREGGRIGPELNVPQSIVEYRPAAQVRAYVRNPQTFRYSQMPAHPQLTDADLDDLIEYFRAMAVRKYDPEGGAQ